MKIDQRDAEAALGGGEVHAHSSWLLPLIVLLVAAAIGVGVYVFLAGPTVEEVQGNFQGNTYSPTADPAPADISIDSALFRIPGNYTMHRRSRSSGDQDDVPLHALLPNLEPWSAAKAAEFSSNLADAHVIRFTLAIDRSRLTYEDKFDKGIRPLADNPDGEAGPFGLTRFKFSAGTGYENTEWFSADLGNGSKLVMRCDASATADFGSNCMRVTRLRDQIGLTYRFKLSQLEHWKETDTRLMALIESLRPKR
ncbi:MAG: hypothetical protein ABL973_01280 [Micropepsaceae bacterium]